MSLNKETGKHSQSILPKCSFNLKTENVERLEAITKELERLTGNSRWTKTEVINFAIELAFRNLPLYEKRPTKNDHVEN